MESSRHIVREGGIHRYTNVVVFQVTIMYVLCILYMQVQQRRPRLILGDEGGAFAQKTCMYILLLRVI